MLGKVLTIKSFPPAILNCNAFLQNRILRNFVMDVMTSIRAFTQYL